MNRPLRIGFLPFYVDYYESLSADFGPRKREEILAARRALEAFGPVLGGTEPLADPAAAAAAGRALREAGAVCLVALCVIAVFSEISDAAIRETGAPLLLWHRQGITTVGPAYSMVERMRILAILFAMIFVFGMSLLFIPIIGIVLGLLFA